MAREPSREIGIGCGVIALISAVFVAWGLAIHNSAITHSVFVVAVVFWIAWIAISSARQIALQRRVMHNRQSWPKVERRWAELYYCYRDDLVFDGTDPGRRAPSAQMRSLLFEGLDLI